MRHAARRAQSITPNSGHVLRSVLLNTDSVHVQIQNATRISTDMCIQYTL